jgi:hypothetical protein
MSELRKMTRMGGDLRKIARLLQDKGRNGDTILAHINPREAALLREQGGSGTINPETGLPEFYDDDYGVPIEQSLPDSEPASSFDSSAFDLYSGGPEVVSGPTPVSNLDITSTSGQYPQELAAQGAAVGATPTDYSLAGVRPPTALGETMAGPQAGPSQAPAEKGLLGSLSGGDKLRLGLGLAGGVQSALTARKARQGSQQAAQQIRDIGRPYQEQGLAQQAAAARGELTPVNQQALEAQRARAAQAGVARGGVGIAQQQRAEEDLRQRLLAAQQDFGLKLSGIGDQYTAKAIQEGIRADSEISAMYANYFGNLTRLAAPTIIQSNQPAKG